MQYKFPLQGFKLKCICWLYTTIFEKDSFCNMQTMKITIITSSRNLLPPWLQEGNIWKTTNWRKLRIQTSFPMFHSKPLKEFGKTQTKKYRRSFQLQVRYTFRHWCKTNFRAIFFRNVANSSRKPPIYTMNNEQVKIIAGKLYQKQLIKTIWQRNQLQHIWIQKHLINYL